MTGLWPRRAIVTALVMTGLWGLTVAITAGVTADDIAFLPAAVAMNVVGAVLILRVPENRITWLVAVVAAAFNVAGLAEEYGSPAVTDLVAAVILFAVIVPIFGVMLPLLFPTGEPLGRRWRWVGRVCWLGVAAMFAGFWWQSATEGNLESDVGCVGPGSCVSLFALQIVLACVVLAVASFVIRWRRSTGVEREQLRWLVPPFVVVMGAVIAEFSGFDESVLVLVLLGVSFFLVPVAIGFAITRYRLYEIDRIISRTVAYALVVGVLVAAVAGVSALAGSRFREPWLVAGTTLGVAALFNPLRRRVQVLVDRRFNRSRYDAERVIEDFTSSLQEEVEAAGVTQGWLAVVVETMQPASMGVWVRG